MPTISTTTNTTPFIYPGTKLLVYDAALGSLWTMVKSSTANTYSLFRSVDLGLNWSLYSSFVRANVVELGSILAYGGAPPWFMYFTYRTNESSEDRVYMRRLDLTTATWESERLIYGVANGGVAGARFQGMDMRVVVTPASGTFIIVAIGTKTGANVGVGLYGVYEPDYYTPSSYIVTQNVIAGTAEWLPEVGAGRIGPSIDLEHQGDSLNHGTSSNLWVTFGSTKLYLAKLAWGGGGWSSPSTPVLMKEGITAQDTMVGRWDGERFLMCVPNPLAGATSTVLVMERNRANSETIERTSPVHPTGVIRNCSLSYNSVSGDFRVFAVGTSTTVLYYVDFIRATGVWSSWTSVLATAVLGATGNNWGVRAGTAFDTKYDVYTAHSGAPNTLTLTQQSLSYAPFAPTWVAPVSGLAADVALTLFLDWTFSDPDPADTQKDYAISRQIGAGTLAYFRASDQTWQPAEVQNASGTSSRTLAAAWAVHTDAAYTFKVKVWDQSNVASAYSDALVVTPSTPVNPTITSPAAAAVIGGKNVTITWTVSQQTAWRVELLTNPGGVLTSDTGWAPNNLVPGTVGQLTYTVPTVLANGTGWTLRLTTKNDEGLQSASSTVNFTVVYVPPATPTLVATPQPTLGVIRVVITNPTPGGAQPAIATNDVYRRVVGAPLTALRVASGVVNNGTYDDWQAVSGVAYEYEILANGVNGASQFGAWTA